MKKIAVIHGPNLNLLGIREPSLYGDKSLIEINGLIKSSAKKMGADVHCFQSNYEGGMVTYIQQALIYGFDSIIINPAALTHTSIAILDALKAVNLPFVEVHLTDINNREEFRKKSYISELALTTISGKGFNGYIEALNVLLNKNHEDEIKMA